MSKFFTKIFWIMFLLGSLFFTVSRCLDEYYATHYVTCSKASWILSKKGETYDFAVVGSSRALNNVYVPLIEDSLEAKGINLGLSGANYAENYLVLREFVNHGNTARTVYIQADVYGMDSPHAYHYPFNDYNYVFLLSDDTVASIFRDYVNPLKFFMWKYIPFAKYAEFSNRYSLYKYLKKGYTCLPDGWNKTSGSELLDTTEGDGNLFREDTHNFHYQVNPLDSFYLGRLIAYCRANNFRVRLFTAPERQSFVRLQANRAAIYRVINRIAACNQVPPCDTNWIPGAAGTEFSFRDNTHLDPAGTLAFSAAMARKIKME